MTKKLAALIGAAFYCFTCMAQTRLQKITPPADKPKIIVGLVIDQMRWDYLYRYQNRYSGGGFKRLLGQGFSFENTLIPYVPTYTAVGHTVIG